MRKELEFYAGDDNISILKLKGKVSLT